MRGRSVNDSFVILDEAQNTSPEQMKMFLTRLGFGSKMVVWGTSPRSTCRATSARACNRRVRHPRRDPGHLVRPLRRRGRSEAPARAADRRRLRRARGAHPLGRLIDHSDVPDELVTAALAVLAAAGVEDGHLSVELVDEGRIPRAEPRASRQGRAHGRPVVPDRRDRRGGRGAARTGRRRHLPGAHGRPRRGDGSRRASPLRVRPRD